MREKEIDNSSVHYYLLQSDAMTIGAQCYDRLGV